jgi:hypothetical protein
MGTRAVISVIGLGRVLATHWDGYPQKPGLGYTLKKAKPKSMDALIKIAADFSINFASPEILEKANKIMLAKYKHPDGSYECGYDWLKESNDIFVSDITQAADWWGYEYFVDLKTGKVTYKEL